jgi:DNA (cytosine-5)-methyltransferase 1
MTFKTIDLFAGVGGIRLGFDKAGFVTVYAEDNDAKCKITYDLNYPSKTLSHADITKLDTQSLPNFDFVLGGFPCQAFSVAGYRQGFEDAKGRGNLFFDIARILKDRKPMGFLLENVKNLRGHDGGNTFKVITEALDALGYEFDSRVLNTMDYGNLPQNRERIYIVGFRKELKMLQHFEWPEPIPLTKKVQDLLDDPQTIDEKYYYNDKPLWEKIKDHPFKTGEVYQWRRKYVRTNTKNVVPTLTANMGMGGHNVPIVADVRGVRKLTPRECFRVQGFPDTYSLPKGLADSHLYKQAGNSVSVTVIERIAQNMKSAIMKSNVPQPTTVRKPAKVL